MCVCMRTLLKRKGPERKSTTQSMKKLIGHAIKMSVSTARKIARSMKYSIWLQEFGV